MARIHWSEGRQDGGLVLGVTLRHRGERVTIYASPKEKLLLEWRGGASEVRLRVSRRTRPDLYDLGRGCLELRRVEPLLDKLAEDGGPFERALAERAARMLTKVRQTGVRQSPPPAATPGPGAPNAH